MDATLQPWQSMGPEEMDELLDLQSMGPEVMDDLSLRFQSMGPEEMHAASLPGPGVNGSSSVDTDLRYRQLDIQALADALRYFFRDNWETVSHEVSPLIETLMAKQEDEQHEQLRSATATFRTMVDEMGVSPLVAFKDVISTTAFFQEMDTRYAMEGGIDYYLRTGSCGRYVSDTLKSALRQLGSLRKVQEIRKLMANSHEDASDGQASDAVDAAEGDPEGRQGAETDGDIKFEAQLPFRGPPGSYQA